LLLSHSNPPSPFPSSVDPAFRIAYRFEQGFFQFVVALEAAAQVGKAGAQVEQFLERLDLRATFSGSKSSMLLKCRSTFRLGASDSSLSLFSTEKFRCGFMPSSTVSKLSGLISTNLRVFQFRKRLFRLPGEIAEDSNHEGQFFQFDSAAHFDVVGNLDAGRTDAVKLMLCTVDLHAARSSARATARAA
jgi:hypothetical protein